MLFKNLATEEQVNVSNLSLRDGRVFFSVRGKGCGQRFFNRNTCLVLDEEAEDGTFLKCAEGWEIVAKERKQPKEGGRIATKKGVKKAQEEIKQNDEIKQENEDEALAKEIAALLASRKNNAGAINREEVEGIFAELLAKYASEQPKVLAKVVKRLQSKEEEKNEVYCDNFNRIKRDLEDGFHVYLFGPAGCGKSHTAEQLAKLLGLEFYGQTTIQFAHDVKGYGDAGGNFQETPFFKAFANGGLYFQDEYDRSFPEATIALNSALANGWYDFPVVGRVYAHENFRFMAAGNTQMTGADEQYVTGQVMDSSSVDRFSCMYEVGYNHTVEMKIAKGNKDLVQFIEDVRRAIAECGIKHVVSYRATAYLINREDDMEFAVKNCVFKTLSVDEIRMICNKLRHTDNIWAKAANKAF